LHTQTNVKIFKNLLIQCMEDPLPFLKAYNCKSLMSLSEVKSHEEYVKWRANIGVKHIKSARLVRDVDMSTTTDLSVFFS